MNEPFPDPELLKPASLRPENLLLLLCAHRGGAAASGRARESAGRDLDWDYLYRLAQRHALLPLLYRGLEEAGRDAAPAPFRDRLRGKFRENATRNTLLAGELVRLARLFESEGVALLAYKGPALAVQAYGELSLRRFIDLDILVRRRDVARACGLLEAQGFAKPARLGAAQERFLLRRQHNLAFARDAGRLTVELHWELAPANFASVPLGEDVWGRAASVKLQGSEVRTLAPEDLLLALSVHGTKHLWERLAWVCDVAALVNSQTNLDWPSILDRARASRVERMLRLALRLARGLLGARLPAEVLAETADPAVRGMASEVAAALFRGGEYVPAGFARGVGFNLRVRGGLREKAGYLRHVLTPTDADLTAVSLPAGMSFLYYLLRPLRLALKGGAEH
ncbi:MAG TPA: nucleotidyltransferase family protein [Pyrinomonadaceae bacterium]